MAQRKSPTPKQKRPSPATKLSADYQIQRKSRLRPGLFVFWGPKLDAGSATMSETIGKLIETASSVLPPLGCAWAWALWLRNRTPFVPKWRRAISGAGLISLTASICFGCIAYVSWVYFDTDRGPSPSSVSQLAAFSGFGLTLCSIPLCIFASSWLRFALLFSAVTLLGFYFLLFISP